MNHANLPSIHDAKLPSRYEAVKLAIIECKAIDECKDWADRAQALASYARQAGDKASLKNFIRIQARALQRCGQLLKEVEAKHTGRIRSGTDPNSSTRKQTAKKAGLSPRQAKDAIRVANINGDSFDQQVESDEPPTVTALAEQGKGAKKGKPFYEIAGMTKDAWQAGMRLEGATRGYAKALSGFDPELAADGLNAKQRKDLLGYISTVDKFHKTMKDLL